eukprot:CAMPEP_0198685814 /NCGR_PEP_ID=MMETSP1468-20131203/14138_1 /TAXON_ID=1461545 /ORGANISM="Mantoniella sp, Strain CCMP1436" /LENGTH=402 /DNA_ID=CAMNT_0044431535 /DNA_START=227 /DNA_END=1440 /DNA_ORIENTATION=-
MPPKDSKLSLGDQKKKLKEKDQRAKDKEKNEKEKERNERKALESKDKVFGLKNKHTSKTVQALVQDVERNAKVIPGEQQKAEAMAREKARVKAGEAQAAKELGALLTKRPDRDADGPLRDAKLDASVAPKPGAKSKGQLASEAQQQQQQRRRQQRQERRMEEARWEAPALEASLRATASRARRPVGVVSAPVPGLDAEADRLHLVEYVFNHTGTRHALLGWSVVMESSFSSKRGWIKRKRFYSPGRARKYSNPLQVANLFSSSQPPLPLPTAAAAGPGYATYVMRRSTVHRRRHAAVEAEAAAAVVVDETGHLRGRCAEPTGGEGRTRERQLVTPAMLAHSEVGQGRVDRVQSSEEQLEARRLYHKWHARKRKRNDNNMITDPRRGGWRLNLTRPHYDLAVP